MEIITNLDLLREPIEPTKFVGDDVSEIRESIKDTVSKLKELLNQNESLTAISAPQIGIKQRIFCIKFKDTIKTFINPIITKKTNYQLAPEVFSSMPGKEIIISRPNEISVVYYNDLFNYEDNKFLDLAARIFEQQAQILDGILPDEAGLVSDIATDGSVMNLSETEMEEVAKIYKQFIETKVKAIKNDILEDSELTKQYTKLKFSEDVINGRSQIINTDDPTMGVSQPMNRAARRKTERMIKNHTKRLNRRLNQANQK